MRFGPSMVSTVDVMVWLARGPWFDRAVVSRYPSQKGGHEWHRFNS